MLFRGENLRPNCLLTIKPIVFLKGSKHIRKAMRHLTNHGYSVYSIDHSNLKDAPDEGHYMLDRSQIEHIPSIQQYASLTIADIQADDLESILDHAIYLAETDFS